MHGLHASILDKPFLLEVTGIAIVHSSSHTRIVSSLVYRHYLTTARVNGDLRQFLMYESVLVLNVIRACDER